MYPSYKFVYALEHFEPKVETFSYFCHLTLTSENSMRKKMKMMRISSAFHHPFFSLALSRNICCVL